MLKDLLQVSTDSYIIFKLLQNLMHYFYSAIQKDALNFCKGIFILRGNLHEQCKDDIFFPGIVVTRLENFVHGHSMNYVIFLTSRLKLSTWLLCGYSAPVPFLKLQIKVEVLRRYSTKDLLVRR